MATYASGFGAAGRLRHLPLRQALEQYAGARQRGALIKLLSPVQRAAEVCGWVSELVDSGEIYRPMAWTAARAYRLLQSVEALEVSGLTVRLPNWWRKRPRPQVSVTIGCRPASLSHCSRARTAWCSSRANGSRWTGTGSARPSHIGRRCKGRPKATGPRHPARREMGGPTASAAPPLRGRVREPARRVAGHGAPLGSHARATQSASASPEGPAALSPAVREVEETVSRRGGSGGETARTTHVRAAPIQLADVAI